MTFFAILAAMIFAVPATTLAAKDWNQKNPQGLGGTFAGAAPSAIGICNALFEGDEENIYRVTICDLVKMVALSVSNFSRELTCTIQGVGNSSNYVKTDFKVDGSGGCTPLAGQSGSPKLSSSAPSQLTQSLSFGAATSGSLSDTGTIASQTIPYAYRVSRNIVSVLIVIALLAFAFASILHIDLNTYSIKKALPAVIFALAGAWLGIYVIYFLSRFVDMLMSLSIFSPEQALHPMLNIFGGKLSASSTGVDNAVILVFQVGGKLLGANPASMPVSLLTGFFGTIMLIVPSLAVFAFEYVLGIRALAVGFLTAIAPFAFVCSILPQTQFLFRKWWTIMLIALLYAPVANFVFFILNSLPATQWNTASSVGFAILWAFKIAVIVFLIRLPFTIENDLKRLTVTLAKTGLGSALGLGRVAAAIERSKEPSRGETTKTTITDKIFSRDAAKRIIADTTFKNVKDVSRQVTSTTHISQQLRERLPRDMTATAIATIASRANQTNLARPANILTRSVADLAPDVFKTVVSRSDHQIWHDTRLIEALKNKDGQTLDNEGAATRADSARKTVRLAQAVDNGRLTNPEAIKFLAQKGALDTVPLHIVKKALEEQVITSNDLVPTFKNQTQNTLKRLETIETRNIKFADSKTIQTQIATDHEDYKSGFHDVSTVIKQVSADPRVTQISPQMVKTIASQIKSAQKSDSFKDYGEYFVRRLGQELQASQSAITSALQKMGAQKPAAEAIGTNMKIGFTQATAYLPRRQAGVPNQGDLEPLRSAFATRDLAYSLGSEIKNQVVEDKTALARSITGKISNTLRADPKLDLSQIKSSLQSSLDKLSKPLSPQEAEAVSRDIEKYHPSATLKVGAEFTESDIEQTKEKAGDVLETVNQLEAAGQDKSNVASKPEEAVQAVGTNIRETIQKAT